MIQCHHWVIQSALSDGVKTKSSGLRFTAFLRGVESYHPVTLRLYCRNFYQRKRFKNRQILCVISDSLCLVMFAADL